MPSNFQEAKTELLQYTKRPDDAEWQAIAGAAINESIVKLQRLIPNMTALQKLAVFTYTGGAVSMSFTDALEETDINKVISVEQVSDSAFFGTPLRCYTFNQLAQFRTNFQDNWKNQEEWVQYATFEEYVKDTYGNFAVILGTDLMLYPSPVNDTQLSINYTPWLAQLVDDSDTNVLLKYCWDFVFYSALVRMNILLSEVDRVQVGSVQLNYALNEARAWNASLEFSNPIDC